jgi:hypothetical protein
MAEYKPDPDTFKPPKHKTVDEVSLEASFASVKGAIEVHEVASLEVYLRHEGKDKMRGKCPLLECNGNSPSFYCYMEPNGRFERWKCHKCGNWGDVIDLYGKMQGITNPAWAMQALADEFGFKLWRPEDFMSDPQRMIMSARRKSEKKMERVMDELAFEKMVMPFIREIGDDDERREMLEECLKLAGLNAPGEA